MNELTIIKQNGGAFIDSREVAEAIGKRHHNLLRDIGSYIDYMTGDGGVIKIDCSSFFIPSIYMSEQNKEMPCYLISKMGCEMVANKLTGEKGVLFTAAYVTKFNEMEQRERAKVNTLAALVPPRWYRPGEIAALCGLYSLGGNPHAQAVSCILNENIFIDMEHKHIIAGEHGATVRYDNYALCEVVQWLVDHEHPDEIYGFERTYYVQRQQD